MPEPVYMGDHAYFDHVASFEKAFPHLDHRKTDPQEGRVTYVFPAVDCLFVGWALGRNELAKSIRNILP